MSQLLTNTGWLPSFCPLLEIAIGIGIEIGALMGAKCKEHFAPISTSTGYRCISFFAVVSYNAAL
jgi:hypothetical protein